MTTKRTLIPVLLFIVFFLGMAYIQFSTRDLPDNDGFYHIKLAWLMRTEGLKPDFPWLPLSILNEKDFYDHHFLFHVALIPFTFGDLRLGAKWAAVTFSALSFLCVWYLFDRQKIPAAPFWALALLGISEAFLYRMSITRVQSLSLGVLALGLAWMLEGRYKHLAVLSFVYVWLYDAFPLMLAVAGMYSAAIFLLEGRLEFRPLLWAGAGIAVGLVINPYFPSNLIFTYHHLLPKLQDATSVRVGNEWYPYTTAQLLENSALGLAILVSGTLALGLGGRKMDVRTATAFFLAILFGVMLFKARRFVEYFPPFALIFGAFAWAPLFEAWSGVQDTVSMRVRSALPSLVLVLAIIAGVGKSFPAVREQMMGSKPYDLYGGASLWLLLHTEEGERVFQTDWDDFPRLFYFNTHNTYLAGLDPTYLQIYDEELYNTWVDITRGKVERPSSIILEDFSARYVHTDLNHKEFLKQAAADPGLKEVYRDGQAVIFQVVEP